MPNPHRGFYEFEVNGKAHRLRFGGDAICSIEAKLEMGIAEIEAQLRDPQLMRFSVIKTMFIAALVDRTDEEGQAVFSELMPKEAINHVLRGYNLAWGDDEDAGVAANPTPASLAGNGTGQSSIPSGSSSDSTPTDSGTKPRQKSAA